jgi:hypothetical protein
VDDTLTAKARSWHTPTSSPDAPNSNSNIVDGPTSLTEQAATLWPTPQAHDERTPKTPAQIAAQDAAAITKRGRAHGTRNLNEDAALWATPRTITGGAESGQRKKELGREDSGGGDLQAQVQSLMWPSPGASDHKGSTQPGQRRRQLSEATETGPDAGRPAPASASSGDASSPPTPRSRPRLNPTFVEWLMDVPRGMTDLGAGTPRADRLRALGNSVVEEQAFAAVVELITRSNR